MKINYLFCLGILFLFLGSTSKKETPLSPKEIFINELIAKMTLEEKIGQMVLFTSDWDVTGPTLRTTYLDDIRAGKAGAVFNAYTVEYNRKLQKIAVEETRLGIPLLFGYDVIHGHRTIFPVPIAESCSWDINAIQNAARIAASEASAEGINWTFAPMVDITRDPRWGRVDEGSGEDVYLGSLIAAARVKGFQGDDLSKNNTIVACAKHFAAYGAAQGGRDYNTVDVSEVSLRETYLPPFKACVDAGVGTFMTAFNDLNGVPASANNYLLNEILRDEWKFKGFVVTDYTSINEMVNHGYASNDKNAGELSLNAGVDMDMQGAVFYNFLKQSVEQGKVTIAVIDNAVKNILGIKYDLGLFEDPYRYCNPEREKTEIMTAENLLAAREMAQKSIVLLKNENGLLPLKKQGTIALIGPLADDQRNLIGNWSAAGDWKKSVSVLTGITKATQGKTNILYSKGANIIEDKILLKKLNDNGGKIEMDTRSPEQMIKDAVDVANISDVVVMVLGESQGMSGEAASRSEIGIPENQRDLLKAIHKTGKPVVLVLMNGRPLTLVWENENIPAIVETWFAGTEAGNAIADILFGDVNPSGKLTMSFPRSVGQIPVYYNMKKTGRPFDANSKYNSKYLDVDNSPLFSFGHGLSYTTFEYSNIKLSSDILKKDKTISISVDVKNSGSRDGVEITQLYITDKVASITRPVKELQGFKRNMLKAGESKTLAFDISITDLTFYNGEGHLIYEPGQFDIQIGGNSDTGLKASFVLE